MSLILTKALEPTRVRLVYDEPSNALLGELTLQLIKLWIDEFAEQDSYILGQSVELIENLLFS
jgi:hypothetical protein